MTKLAQISRRIDARAKPMTAAIAALLTRMGRELARRAITQMRASGKFAITKVDDWGDYNDELMRILELYGMRQYSDAARTASDEAGGGWVITPSLVSSYVEAKQIQVTGLMDDTREAALASLQQIIVEAQSEDPVPSAGEVARRIRTQYHGPEDGRAEVFSSERAALIARTELTQDENSGIYQGYKDTAPADSQIEWLAYRDGRSGDRAHDEMHGERVTIGAYFVTPLGNQLLYPGDPAGPIKELANCRCSHRLIQASAK